MSEIEPILHPIVIAQVMINFAAKYGVDKETCLLGTGINTQQLADADALITRSQEMRLVENIILALPTEPALGFKLGLQYSVATFGVWGFALRTSRTLREAMSVAIRYLPLSTAYSQLHLIENQESVGVVVDADNIPAPLRQFLLERDMATSINLLNELSLSGISYSQIELKGPPPSYAEYIKEAFGITPIYNSARNIMYVSKTDANRSLPTYDAQLVHLMKNQCQQQLELRQQSGVTGQVRQQILGPLGLIASLEDVSSALAMSPRSLRRKLESEGTSFKQLLDNERQASALQLLKNSDMKLEELAFHLGYTDTASFARAFRRWQACSPGEYRRSLRN
jgi:AraC-like DNA-binding protein